MTHAFLVKLGAGAFSGWLGAAAVDLHAFLTWKNASDFKTWDWRTALLRCGQGIVVGLFSAAGYGAVLG